MYVCICYFDSQVIAREVKPGFVTFTAYADFLLKNGDIRSLCSVFYYFGYAQSIKPFILYYFNIFQYMIIYMGSRIT
jgi:hypothetical protein